MKNVQLFFLSILTAFGMLMVVSPAFAQVDVLPENTVCRDRGSGTSSPSNSVVCRNEKEAANKNPVFGPDGLLTRLISILSIIVGIAAVIVIMVAGMKYITSGSNAQDVNTAREMIIYAAVGLILAAAAQIIVRLFLFKIGD